MNRPKFVRVPYIFLVPVVVFLLLWIDEALDWVGIGYLYLPFKISCAVAVLVLAVWLRNRYKHLFRNTGNDNS